jgi:hypothetical protein
MRPSIAGPSATRGSSAASSRFLLAAAALLASSGLAGAQVVLPQNVSQSCTVSPVQFASWFEQGSVTPNGIVEAADGLTFLPSSNCDFYKWSAQMFLWLTSPAPPKYGQGSHVFNSPVFYDVSPVDGSGNRTLIPNAPNRIRNFAPFITQFDKRGNPAVVDAQRKLRSVIRLETGPTGKPAVRSRTGQLTEIQRTEIAPNGKPNFLDATGKPIEALAQNGNPVLRDKAGKPIEIRGRVVIKGKTFLVDAAGNLVDTEQGQAGGGAVLMAQPPAQQQSGSLVYYALQVNDVYAYFLTGTKDNQILPAATQFPTTSAQLAQIKAYGLQHNKTFPDANALTVEVKSSWIDASGLANPGDYVTIEATIPTYTQVSNTQWNLSGTATAKLALVGLHVVGTVAGQPEMLWATFEHVNNTANATYTYTTTNNTTQTVPQQNSGTFVFTKFPLPSNPDDANNERMAVSATGITAETGQTIGPSNLLRLTPWGTAPGSTFTGNNTDVISLNNSVISQLAAGDVRKNYLHIGTVWTKGGAPPSTGVQVGTTALANTTMETYFQNSVNCFGCHSDPPMLGGPGNSDGGLSHIWGPIKPLF